MTLTSGRIVNLRPPADLSVFERCAPEIRDMFWKRMLPSGLTYIFNGFSAPELESSRQKLPNLFRVNKRFGEDITRIWLEQNQFTLYATSAKGVRFVRVATKGSKPLENDIESNVRMIASMMEYTPLVKVELHCKGHLWAMFVEFFAIVQLLQKHAIPVTVNGVRPAHHPTNTRQEQRIKITFQGRRKVQLVLLKILEFAHRAREMKMAPNHLKSQFDAILKREGCRKAMTLAKPTMYHTVERVDLMHGVTAYLGPNDLLYETVQGAAGARRVVNNLGKPSTKRFSRPWVIHVLASLDVWRGILKVHLAYLQRSKQQVVPYVLPTYVLPGNSVFKHYGNDVWSTRPTTEQELDAHIKGCGTELYRTEAHIKAMLPHGF